MFIKSLMNLFCKYKTPESTAKVQINICQSEIQFVPGDVTMSELITNCIGPGLKTLLSQLANSALNYRSFLLSLQKPKFG